MNFRQQPAPTVLPGLFLAAALIVLSVASSHSQAPLVVTDEASWNAAIAAANANASATTTIVIQESFSATSALFINANIDIIGNGHAINMQNSDRALFIAGGTVSLSGLTIENGNATGGTGYDFGGGGMGAGGAIFIGSGTYDSGGANLPSYVTGISAPNVTLTNVSFTGNQATGGLAVTVSTGAGGGGGGLGGNGAPMESNNTSGGGGGIASSQYSATAGTSGNDGAPGLFNIPGQPTPGGDGGSGEGSDGGNGGANGGGGGGGGNQGTFYEITGGGGGGGVNGERGYFQNSDYPNGGGDGGFGGGGGGSTEYYGGNGGFGGGGGGAGGGISGNGGNGGNGGFGGGGGNGQAGGSGGFGAGPGSDGASMAGAGMGAGGAIFLMQGATLTVNVTGSTTFNGNAANIASPSLVGSAYGNDLFLGANANLNISPGQILVLDSLGGAGNTSDPNVSNAPSEQIEQAQGGIVLDGGGQLILTGTNYYAGATVIRSGTLSVGQNAREQGTSGVTVGQASGDRASLILNSNSALTLGTTNSGTITVASGAGSKGDVIIGSGTGSSGASLGAAAIVGGSGTATLIFNQNFAAGSTTDTNYAFDTPIQGTIAVHQNGPGATTLSQANSYSGPTLVNSGTLIVANANALGSGAVSLKGGALLVNSGSAIPNPVRLQGGQYDRIMPAGADLAQSVNATSGFEGGSPDTTATILQGTLTSATTLITAFTNTSSALNEGARRSDVYSFAGTGTDPFVLQLSLSSVSPDNYLGWLNGDGQWVNAVIGNTGANSILRINGAYDGNLVLGHYGVDPATGAVWAVINANGNFAIIPEPSTLALLLAGTCQVAGALLHGLKGGRRRRKATVPSEPRPI